MLPENYRNLAIISLFMSCFFIFIAYSLLQKPSSSQLATTIAQDGYIYPILNFNLPQSFRLLIDGIFVVIIVFFGFLSVYFISCYIDYKKRS